MYVVLHSSKAAPSLQWWYGSGWVLSYADLTPNSERTIPGQVFLATNIAYTIVGIILPLRGEVLLGFLTDVCSFASFTYYYTQLQQPYGRTQDSTVKLALLLDYFLAITSILIGISYVVADQTLPPIEGIATSILNTWYILPTNVLGMGKGITVHYFTWSVVSLLCSKCILYRDKSSCNDAITSYVNNI